MRCPPPPPPQPTQPGVVPFRRWRADHAYLIDCIQHCIETGLAARDVRLDACALRWHLERHLYRTSSNRFRSFVMLK